MKEADKIKAEVFDLLKNIKGITYQDYEVIVSYISEFEHKTKGEENAKFYEHLRKLSNSVNNAGWQERHSEHISTIGSIISGICDTYEDFLP
jgi:hypothetical protein